MRLAVAALLAGLKPTRRAGSRCRNRMARAVVALETRATPLEKTDDTASAAADWLRQGCQACGKCPGLAVMR